MALVYDDGLEHPNLWAEHHILKPEGLSSPNIPHKILAEALVVDNGHLVHTH